MRSSRLTIPGPHAILTAHQPWALCEPHAHQPWAPCGKGWWPILLTYLLTYLLAYLLTYLGAGGPSVEHPVGPHDRISESGTYSRRMQRRQLSSDHSCRRRRRVQGAGYRVQRRQLSSDHSCRRRRRRVKSSQVKSSQVKSSHSCRCRRRRWLRLCGLRDAALGALFVGEGTRWRRQGQRWNVTDERPIWGV